MKKGKILVCMAMFCLLSCEDILDIKPTTFLSDAVIWDDKKLIDQFVANIYGSLVCGFNRSQFGNIGMNFDSGTDDIDPKWDAETNQFNTGEITAMSCPFINQIWSSNYSIIRKCNLLIEGIDKANDKVLDEQARKRYKAEAYFLRAFCYFDLAKTFGKAPLIDHAQKLDEDLLVAPADFEGLIRFVASECDKYADDLYSHKEMPYSERGHATKGAFLALKARALLYLASPLNNPSGDVQRWADAAEAADDVRKLNDYSLYREGATPYYSLFLDKTARNNEYIFEKRFHFNDSYHDIHKLWSLDPVDRGAWNSLYPTQNLAEAYEMKNGLFVSDPESGWAPTDQKAYSNRDSRFEQTLLWHGRSWETTTILMHTNTSGSGHGNSQNSMYKARCGYGPRKFLEDHGAHSAGELYGSPPAWAQDNSWPYFRYAEVLLNYAEAKNESLSVPDQSVYEAVNEVRSRAGQPGLPAGLSKEQMRARIKNERRVELVMEEHRFFDLRRWKDADKLRETVRGMFVYYNPSYGGAGGTQYPAGNSYVIQDVEPRVFSESHYYLPIPQGEVDKNPLLAK
jgi:hypothetical protein